MDDSWVIIWYRAYTTYPTMTSNIADERAALEMAKEMKENPQVASLVCVCCVAELGKLGGGWEREVKP